MPYALCDVYCENAAGRAYCCPFGSSCDGGCTCSWLYWGTGPCRVAEKAWLMLAVGVLFLVSGVLVLQLLKKPRVSETHPESAPLVFVYPDEIPPAYQKDPPSTLAPANAG